MMQTPSERKSKLNHPLTKPADWLFRVEYVDSTKKRCGACEACHCQQPVCLKTIEQRFVKVSAKYWRTAHQEAWKGDSVVRVHTIATPFDKIESFELKVQLGELWAKARTPERWIDHDKFMARIRTKPNGHLNGAAKSPPKRKRRKA